ncbi:MAG: hypothetical protein VB018_09375 [Lachnospiraceae bacterium]|nr:hypothetical protein [Lachnospiraceae bacterium]
MHKFHILPSEFLNLEKREKAFVIASIDEKIRIDKEAAKKIKKK